MNNKKRPKTSRQRGSHTHGRGFKKKARGKGHRGGIGKAGSGKRADQKKKLVVNGKKYFGRAKTRRAAPKVTVKTITLQTIQNSILSLVKNKTAVEKSGGYEINVPKMKVIGNAINLKVTIKALAASEGAQAAVKKAGGEIIITQKAKKEEAPIETGAEDENA